jgi:predicted N-acetyltransferase YhbS
LHNHELHSLYSSLNIVRVIKSRRMRWVGMWHAWRRGEVFTGFWLGSLKVRDHWEDLGIGERIILSWTLGRWGTMGQTGCSWLMMGSNGKLL